MKFGILGSSTLLVSSLLLAAPSFANDTFNDAQTKAIEEIVHQYLVNNPEILIETAKALESKQAQSQEKFLGEAIEYFTTSEEVPMRGNKNAKHYLIEFFDYNCGYCKMVRPHVKRLMAENDIKVLYVEYPILSPLSVRASAIGLALFKEDKEKYLKYQDILMDEHKRISSENQIKDAVKAVGGDYDKLSKVVNDDDKIQALLQKNMELGQLIGAQGTPFFILDGNVIRGAVREYETFSDLLKE